MWRGTKDHQEKTALIKVTKATFSSSLKSKEFRVRCPSFLSGLASKEFALDGIVSLQFFRKNWIDLESKREESGGMFDHKFDCLW